MKHADCCLFYSSATVYNYFIVIEGTAGLGQLWGRGRGGGTSREFSVAMALLLEGGVVHPLSSVTNIKKNKSVVHVKLTDSALKCFENIARQKVLYNTRVFLAVLGWYFKNPFS